MLKCCERDRPVADPTRSPDRSPAAELRRPTLAEGGQTLLEVLRVHQPLLGGGLLLDERDGISYPDGQQAGDGTIYITYDINRRGHGKHRIHFAAFREEDAAAGRIVTDAVRLRQLVSYTLRNDKISNVENDASRFIKDQAGARVTSMVPAGMADADEPMSSLAASERGSALHTPLP